jgi:hypothetical protein
MSVVAPPPPPRPDELEALIREARARQRRRWMIAAVVVAAVAGAVVSPYAVAHDRGNRAARAGSQVPAGANRCRAGQLAISVVRTGAVMGEEGGLLRFTNMSRISCHIAGWPSVTAVEAGGRTISSTHAEETMLFGWNGLAGRRLPMLRLAHGASAYAILASGDTPLGRNPPPSCPTARRLVVTAPKTRGAVSLSGWLPNDVTALPLCDHGTLVSPVLPLSAILH